ncbi:hypothetical protein EVAR_44843_1 [Eumeta japonica]|uniref:Uncharacterized protein n=1 Tax=Eumeta variegata TaxID=151549 RepID=A0A4C1YI58_EUMVA|nr:hypothetical protein EVAR_44843_1 [Eumeta japonica]
MKIRVMAFAREIAFILKMVIYHLLQNIVPEDIDARDTIFMGQRRDDRLGGVTAARAPLDSRRLWEYLLTKMIGAMPAVAVRHERRRAEKRGCGGGRRRPSQLALPLGRAGSPDDTPSPHHARALHSELYVCGKVAALHAVVGSLLLGIVVLVVGLVQLSPGAEAAQHRFYLMGAGAALVGAGVLGALLRCGCLHWYNRKMRRYSADQEQPAPAKNGVSVVESGRAPAHEHRQARLRSQQSVGSPRAKELDALIKQPSATVDT